MATTSILVLVVPLEEYLPTSKLTLPYTELHKVTDSTRGYPLLQIFTAWWLPLPRSTEDLAAVFVFNLVKNLAVPKRRGNNLLTLFFDVFQSVESEFEDSFI